METELERITRELYEVPKFTEKNLPEHTREFLKELGDPQESFRVIHVAGSNGKGSVCALLESMLRSCGQRTGLFVSPHLTDIRERFQIDGELCTEEAFLKAYEDVRQTIRRLVMRGLPHPTFFEILFAVGMVIFFDAGVQTAVVETGLGGRLDATNIIRRPKLCIITSISREHIQYLGDTITEIAGEKAGIIKPGVPVVYDASDDEAASVILARARALGCPAVGVRKHIPADEGTSFGSFPEKKSTEAAVFWQIQKIRRKEIDFSLYSPYDGKTDWRLPFTAEYQVQNAALSITGMRLLYPQFPKERMEAAAFRTRWPGRMEEILPEVWLEGAHNEAGIHALTGSVRRICAGDAHRPVLLFSMLKDKDYSVAVRILAGEAEWECIVVTAVSDVRCLPADELAAAFHEEYQKKGSLNEEGTQPAAADDSCRVMKSTHCETEELCRVVKGTSCETGTEAETKAENMSSEVAEPEIYSLTDEREALSFALKKKKDGQKVFCAGSLYLIGELRSILEKR